MNLLMLALRNVWLRRKSFGIVLIIISIGVAICISIQATIAGLINQTNSKSERYFGGTLLVTKIRSSYQTGFDPDPAVFDALNERFGGIGRVTKRSIYYKIDGQIIAEGTSLRQRRIIGVDWQRELGILENMAFVHGGLTEPSDETILVSLETARELKVNVGTSVTLVARTDAGQINTIPLKVGGIFRESSIFSFAAYVSIGAINQVQNLDAEYYNQIAIFLNDRHLAPEAETLAYDTLSAFGETYGPFDTKADYDSFLNTGRRGLGHAVLNLRSRMDELYEIVDALSIVNTAGLMIVVTVLFIATSNAFRMVLRDRSRELATIRALGCNKMRFAFILYLESAVLSVVGIFVGFGISNLVHSVIGSLIVEQKGFVELVLADGHVLPDMTILHIAVAAVVAFIGGMLGVAGPISAATRTSIVKGLHLE